MNREIIFGRFRGDAKTYRSENGRYYFKLNFIDQGDYFDIYCTYHPSFNGQDSNPHKTHLYRSGKICFAEGHEPKTQKRAEELAAQWAEYFLEYRKTGIAQS